MILAEGYHGKAVGVFTSDFAEEIGDYVVYPSGDTQWGGEGQPPYPGYANNTIRNEGVLTIENAYLENRTQKGGASYVQSGDDHGLRRFVPG